MQVTVYKAPVIISSYALHTQEWSNLTRDDVFRLGETPPLVNFLVGWFAGFGPVHIHPENGNCKVCRNVGY
jgi:hypothetical protein